MVERPADLAADLYTFGWRHLGPALGEHWWFYLTVVLLDAYAVAAGPPIFHWEPISGLAAYPALAAAVRLFRPSFKMTAPIVVGLLAIWCVQILGTALLAGLPYLLYKFVSRDFGFLFLVTLPVLIWLGTKFTPTQALYAVQNGRASTAGAFACAWSFVDTDRWFRVLGLGLLIGLTIGIPGEAIHWGIVALVSGFAGSDFATIFAGALASSITGVIATVWNQLSLTGMAARILPSESLE